MSELLTPPHEAVLAAIDAARHSGCRKSRRGVSVFAGRLMSVAASNRPAMGACDGSEACRRDCGKICVHAEQFALLWHLPHAVSSLSHVDFLHVKVDEDGRPVPSGKPSCAECSKLMLASGCVRGMWLLTDEGWRRWTVEEFHRETLANLKLHGG